MTLKHILENEAMVVLMAIEAKSAKRNFENKDNQSHTWH